MRDEDKDAPCQCVYPDKCACENGQKDPEPLKVSRFMLTINLNDVEDVQVFIFNTLMAAADKVAAGWTSASLDKCYYDCDYRGERVGPFWSQDIEDALVRGDFAEADRLTKESV